MEGGQRAVVEPVQRRTRGVVHRIVGAEHGRGAVARELHVDPPAVRRVRHPAHEPGLLEPVHHPGRGAGREGRELAQAAHRHRALGAEEAEDLHVGRGQAHAGRDALAVGGPAGRQVGRRAEDRRTQRVSLDFGA